MFVCEAYTYDKTVRYHLSYATIREKRKELGDGRLVLTHMGPDMLARLAEVEDQTAHGGLVVELWAPGALRRCDRASRDCASMAVPNQAARRG